MRSKRSPPHDAVPPRSRARFLGGDQIYGLSWGGPGAVVSVSRPQSRRGPPQTFVEAGLRLPPDDLAGACDVWLPHMRVIDGERLEDDFTRRGGDTDHCLGRIEQGHLVGIAKVDREVLARLGQEG